MVVFLEKTWYSVFESEVKTLYLTVKQQVTHLSKEAYESIKELSHIAKNLYNQGLYNIRQHYFEYKKILEI